VAAAEAGLPRRRTRWLVGDHDLHAHRPSELAEVVGAWP